MMMMIRREMGFGNYEREKALKEQRNKNLILDKQ
jgi:hypothetical protein